MKIYFGMPECLVIGSFYIQSQHFWYSIFLLSIGVLSRLITWGAVEAQKQKDRETLKNVLSGIGNMIGTFSQKSTDKNKKSYGQYH